MNLNLNFEKKNKIFFYYSKKEFNNLYFGAIINEKIRTDFEFPFSEFPS